MLPDIAFDTTCEAQSNDDSIFDFTIIVYDIKLSIHRRYRLTTRSCGTDLRSRLDGVLVFIRELQVSSLHPQISLTIFLLRFSTQLLYV